MIKTINRWDRFKTLLSIFFISVSLFVYQVVLTRIYSAVLSYHYVFLITSLAIFGLGIGSIFAFKLRENNPKIHSRAIKIRTKLAQGNIFDQISRGSIVLGASYMLVYTLNYLLPFVNNILVYIVLGTIPFIIGGYLFSILFSEHSEISGKLYFADLIGSGAGSIAVVSLMNHAGMFRTVVMVSIIAFIPFLILTESARKIRSAAVIIPLLVAVLLFIPGQYISSIEQNFNGILDNSAKTYGSVKKSGLEPEIVYSNWNAFSRTDVIKLNKNPDEMILTIDGTANAPMYKFNGDVKSLKGYKVDTGFMPFAIGKNDKTLLIGPGGGRDVLYALAGGSKDISAVEINTSSIDAVKAFSEYNGGIYNRPEVKVYGEDGRSFVRKTNDKYDLIFLSLVMTNSSQGVGYALSENYIYTVEAMGDYLDHLNENGKLAFLAHDQDDLSKIVATAMQSLEKKGIPLEDTPNYISIFSKYIPQQHGGSHLHTPVIIIKDQPFSEKESRELLDLAEESGNVALYAPMVYEEGVLQHIRDEHISMADYLNGFDTNVTPATDDNPYFYNFGKGIPSTLMLILIVVLMGSMILFAPFATKDRNLKPCSYFGLLGAGFMMIEVPLIQQFILYLGHPTLAFTYVLAALLIGGGLGGYLSDHKLFNKMKKAFYLPPVFVAIINIAVLLSLDAIFQSTSNLGLTGRILIASIIVMLQGFFMGMPFPRGLKLIGENGRGNIIPVMWGVNGVMSVVGSVLSIILSMSFGFTGALITGSVIYLIVSLYKTL